MKENAGIKGKILYGAIAGMVIDDRTWVLAPESGLYAIEIHERSEQLFISKPEQRGTW